MAEIGAEVDGSEVFLQHLLHQINTEDVSKLIDMQQHMLVRFEKTNEMLTNFNLLSSSRHEAACLEFRRHCQLLIDLKRDLDFAFKRIRALKSKLGRQYPNALKACGDSISFRDDDEEEDDAKTPVAKAAPTQLNLSSEFDSIGSCSYNANSNSASNVNKLLLKSDSVDSREIQ